MAPDWRGAPCARLDAGVTGGGVALGQLPYSLYAATGRPDANSQMTALRAMAPRSR